MYQAKLDVKGRCTARLRWMVTVFGKEVDKTRILLLKRGSASVVVDDDKLVFSGRDAKEGLVRADIRTADVRSLLLNIRRPNVLMIVIALILMAAGLVALIVSWASQFAQRYPYYPTNVLAMMIGFISSPILVLVGIVLLVNALKRAVEFRILATSNLFNFLTLSLRGRSAPKDVSKFIDDFWALVSLNGQGQGAVPAATVTSSDVPLVPTNIPTEGNSLETQGIWLMESTGAGYMSNQGTSPATHTGATPGTAPRAGPGDGLGAAPGEGRGPNHGIDPEVGVGNLEGGLTFLDEGLGVPSKREPGQTENEGGDSPETFTCNVCFERFNTREGLLVHKRVARHW